MPDEIKLSDFGLEDLEIGEFRPHASYNSGLDTLTYLHANGLTVAEPLDNRLMVLWNSERTKILGIRIEGFVQMLKESGYAR